VTSHERTGQAEPPDLDVVLTSRARIARNLSGLPFVHRATADQRQSVISRVQLALEPECCSETTTWVDLESVSPLQRRVLYERHLISRQHADQQGPRGVAVAQDESMSVMVNEEDHVRMHALSPGLQPHACFERVLAMDKAAEGAVEWAFHERWGYQTACPTNAGTGVRFSAMLHLPALRLTRELEKVRHAAKDLQLAVRGYYGEGSESSGHFYQVSNQITLGCTEEELLDRFMSTIVPGIVEYERSARQALLRRDRLALEDRVHRDLAILRSARVMKVDEAMRRLSTVRLGVCLELIPNVALDCINGLFQMIQSGHLQQQAGKSLSPPESQAARAELLRQRLSG
jgi:protein arginine kinase